MKAHPQPVPPELTARALAVIGFVGSGGSELAHMWADADPDDAKAWRESLKDLAARVKG